MSLLRLCPCSLVGRRQLHLPASPRDAYSSEAVYPALPRHADADRHRRESLCNYVNRMRTAEERLYFADKPKYYGWYSYVLKQKCLPVGRNLAHLVDYATHTHQIRDSLPPQYAVLDKEAEEIAETVSPLLLTCLSNLETSQAGFEVPNDLAPFQQAEAVPSPKDVDGERLLGQTGLVHPAPDVQRQRRLVGSINAVITKVLRQRGHEVMRDCVEDWDVRNEAFWFRGGFDPDERMLRKRRGWQKHLKNPMSYVKNKIKTELDGIRDEVVNARYERCMQYEGKPLVQLRHGMMLSPFVEVDDDLCHATDAIPLFHNDPKEAGVPAYNQNGSNVPGFWTCTDRRYIRLSLLDNCDAFDNEERQIKDELLWTTIRENHLNAKLVLASFGALLASSTHLGFGPFLNPTQPMSTQTVLTDGLRFKFGVYQLNTTNLIEDFTQMEEEERKDIANNICWNLPEQFLFNMQPDGKLEINMETLKTLIKFYINKPNQVIETDIKYVHEIANDYNRTKLFENFRYLYSKRPRKIERPEIMAWQKLHMIDSDNWFPFGNREKPWFKMAQIDFLGKEHWHPEFKHLDYNRGKHIPRAHREGHKQFNKEIKVVPPIPEDPAGEAPTSFQHPLGSSFARKVRYVRTYKGFFLKN